jgi:hypothetical protein
MQTDIYVLSWIRTHDPSFRASEYRAATVTGVARTREFRMVRWLAKNGWIWMWNGTVVAKFMILFGGTEDNLGKRSVRLAGIQSLSSTLGPRTIPKELHPLICRVRWMTKYGIRWWWDQNAGEGGVWKEGFPDVIWWVVSGNLLGRLSKTTINLSKNTP